MGRGQTEDFEGEEVIPLEMTVKRLESYQRLMQEIIILRCELNEMNTTDAGLGSSVIKDYSKGFERSGSSWL